MISVNIKRCRDAISEMVIQDHAGYREKGEDLVCAGVSSIAIGALNAIDLMKHDVCDLVMNDAYIQIAVKQNDREMQLLLEMLKIQLATVEERYPQYITITDQEVS